MKIKDMNAHQLAMYKLMDEVTTDFIGGYENTMLDNVEGSKEYQEAHEFLTQGHDNLKQFFYDMIMARTSKDKKYALHARFAGTEFLMERIEVRLTKWGY